MSSGERIAPNRSPLVVVCPDKFRGSLTAADAAALLGAPFRERGVGVVEVPLSDGGEGFLEIVAAGWGAGRTTSAPVERRTTRVEGPTGAVVVASWALTDDGVAIVESARACGHPAQGLAPVDPVAATTRGVGELVAAARDAGARRVLLGIGGTLTTDGGLGALQALDWDAAGLEIDCAVDTRTRYLDAANVFGPQKGASPEVVAALTDRLGVAARTIVARTGVDVTVAEGGGAGGGLAGGLVALGASLHSGAAVVASATGLAAQLQRADLVVTAEGRLDRSSLSGKAIGWVVDHAPPGGRAVVVGDADDDALLALPDDVVVRVLRHRARDLEDSMARAAELLAAEADRLASELVGRAGGPGHRPVAGRSAS